MEIFCILQNRDVGLTAMFRDLGLPSFDTVVRNIGILFLSYGITIIMLSLTFFEMYTSACVFMNASHNVLLFSKLYRVIFRLLYLFALWY